MEQVLHTIVCRRGNRWELVAFFMTSHMSCPSLRLLDRKEEQIAEAGAATSLFVCVKTKKLQIQSFTINFCFPSVTMLRSLQETTTSHRHTHTNNTSASIIRLNNEALKHFVCGDRAQAIVLLQLAYEIFHAHRYDSNQALALPTPPSNINTGAVSSSSNGSGSNSMMCLPQAIHVANSRAEQPQVRLPAASTTIEGYEAFIKAACSRERIGSDPTATIAQTGSSSTAYSIYNRALILPEGEHDESLLRVHAGQTSAILLYNLGLVYHNVGVYMGVSSALWHSLRLYEMALESIDAVPGAWAHMEKLVMALLNNMGNIHAYLFHVENTNACMKNLQLVLSASRSLANLDEDYIFFFLNALFTAKQLDFAPAA